jgi:hypothetical protein
MQVAVALATSRRAGLYVSAGVHEFESVEVRERDRLIVAGSSPPGAQAQRVTVPIDRAYARFAAASARALAEQEAMRDEVLPSRTGPLRHRAA